MDIILNLVVIILCLFGFVFAAEYIRDCKERRRIKSWYANHIANGGGKRPLK